MVKNLLKFYEILAGGDADEGTPVPIPNTEVKLIEADGTCWETDWESRKPPAFFYWYSVDHTNPSFKSCNLKPLS